MRIALIAHDSRKELMAQFCTAYVRILSENDLIATGVTGKIVHDATGLPVRTLYPGGRGGAEQIAAMIGCGEVDMLLFFRDPVGAKPGEPNDMMLLRLCDMHTIPVATNIATAEVLIHGLERGDLAWIELQRWSEITKKATSLILKKAGRFQFVQRILPQKPSQPRAFGIIEENHLGRPPHGKARRRRPPQSNGY